MEPLAAQFVDRLSQGVADRDILHHAGEPDPPQASQAFLKAASDPDLGPQRDRWAPALLRTARPGFGAQCLAELCERFRELRGRPLDVGATPALPLLLGSSNFLARLLLRHPDRVDALQGPSPPPPDAVPADADWDAIRRAKYLGLLRIAARDLVGRPFRESFTELSELADGCLRAALARVGLEVPIEAPALLALGKLGGRELNFSSDVDLLFVYEPPAGEDALEHHQAVSRLIHVLKRELESPSADGFGYRVDLDLRPEGRAGVLANSVDAALTYYESFGAEWERQMLIRLRPVAGPPVAASAFARGITPFVYRRLIDPGVMHSVREMKARVEEERRRAGRDIEVDLKEGPGGIRDVEFLVQSLQLFYGGREPELRTGNVLDALDVIGARGLLPETITQALQHAYLWLRRAEHGVQLPEEQQTARFPRNPAGQLALARRMGYAEPEGDDARTRMLDDWTALRGVVRAHFEALVLSEES